MIRELSLTEFNSALASSSPTPGGGGVSALCGALGCGLGLMVSALTVGKKKYAANEAELLELSAQARRLQTRLLELIDLDAEAFEPLSRVYAMPKDADGRAELMEKCLLDAAGAPMAVLRLSAEAVELTERFAALGSKLALSDAGCSAVMLKAAMQSAALNVLVNTRLMSDRETAQRLEAEAEQILNEYEKRAEAVYTAVKCGL